MKLTHKLKYRQASRLVKEVDSLVVFISKDKNNFKLFEKSISNSLYKKDYIILDNNQFKSKDIKLLNKAQYIITDSIYYPINLLSTSAKVLYIEKDNANFIKYTYDKDDKHNNHQDNIDFFNKIDMLVVPSEYKKEEYIKNFKVPKNKIEVIGNPFYDFLILNDLQEKTEQFKIQNEQTLVKRVILYSPGILKDDKDIEHHISNIKSIFNKFNQDFSIYYYLENNEGIIDRTIDNCFGIKEDDKYILFNIADYIVSKDDDDIFKALILKKNIILLEPNEVVNIKEDLVSSFINVNCLEDLYKVIDSKDNYNFNLLELISDQKKTYGRDIVIKFLNPQTYKGDK